MVLMTLMVFIESLVPIKISRRYVKRKNAVTHPLRAHSGQ